MDWFDGFPGGLHDAGGIDPFARVGGKPAGPPLLHAARGFMFALGCIQAQTCHTGNCPTGVTTQDPHRQQALDVGNKADRVYHFHEHTLLALKELVQAAGLAHPREITASHIVRRMSDHGVKLLANLLPFVQPGSLLRGETPHQVFRIYWPMARAASFAAVPHAPGDPSVIPSEAKDLVASAR